ncbi:MAG TPA: tetratricopeptide repeat protein [Polyangia bacterium]
MPVCLALWAGCGPVLSSGDATPGAATGASDLPPGIRGLRVQVAEEVAIVVEGNADPGLSEQLRSALQAELGRLGLTVLRASDKSSDLTLRIDTRVTGAINYLRGRVGLTAEKGGLAVALAATEVELHSSSEFSAVMTQKAAAALLHSPALSAFAEKKGPNREVVRMRPQPATPAPLTKAPRSATSDAKAHSNRGTSMYNLGRFSEALSEYEAAYLAVQDPPFLFNIAQCHRKMGKNKEALESYRSYLRVAPDAPNRAEVQRRISELERQAHATR